MSDDDTIAISGERNGGVDRLKRWFLLDGNRLSIVAVVMALLVGSIAVLELAGLVPLQQKQPLFYVFSGLIGGNLTLITVVVSINQLLLSREFKSPGELQSQIEGVDEYRKEVEESAGEIAPVEPLGFLKLLFQNTRQEAQRLGGLVIEMDGQAGEEVESLVTPLTDHFDAITDRLGEPDMNTFEVLSVTLTTNYADEINRIRRIRASYGDELPDAATDAIDRLVEHLRRIDVARQYFKGVYLQNELSSLSRVLFYAGIPAELTSVAALLALTTSPRAVFATGYTYPLLLFVISAGFLPLVVLFSYILRTATVTQRTSATLPFTTREEG